MNKFLFIALLACVSPALAMQRSGAACARAAIGAHASRRATAAPAHSTALQLAQRRISVRLGDDKKEKSTASPQPNLPTSHADPDIKLYTAATQAAAIIAAATFCSGDPYIGIFAATTAGAMGAETRAMRRDAQRARQKRD